jgi:hypothetical protein
LDSSSRVTRALWAAALSPGVVVFASAIRLLIIANYDPTTALSIAAANGVIGTLLGTLIPLIPPFLPVLALILLALWKRILFGFAVFGIALVSPAYTTLKSALRTTEQQFVNCSQALNSRNSAHLLSLCWKADRPSLIFGFIIVVIIAIDNQSKITSKLFGDKDDETKSEWSVVGTAVGQLALAVPIAILFATLFFFTTTIYHIPTNMSEVSSVVSKPWLPSELMTVKAGSEHVGYTLSDNNGWFVFLLERTRTIEYIPSDDVVSRTLCRLIGAQRPNQFPLIRLINAPAPQIIQCPNQ